MIYYIGFILYMIIGMTLVKIPVIIDFFRETFNASKEDDGLDATLVILWPFIPVLFTFRFIFHICIDISDLLSKYLVYIFSKDTYKRKENKPRLHIWEFDKSIDSYICKNCRYTHKTQEELIIANGRGCYYK
jgi:hypothetical protein